MPTKYQHANNGNDYKANKIKFHSGCISFYFITSKFKENLRQVRALEDTIFLPEMLLKQLHRVYELMAALVSLSLDSLNLLIPCFS